MPNAVRKPPEDTIVARQYTAWCYPKPSEDIAADIARGVYDYTDPSFFRRALWPRQTEPKELDILIAGCGTNQAAMYAYQNPDCRFTAIDLSRTSLEHEKFLQQKHGLKNLTLHHMNLLDVQTLGKDFDYIVSTGVLHHMPDPDAGLAALKTVLRPNGVMSLMLYGQHHRAGVYIMQDAFRRLGLKQTAEDVKLVKETLGALPPWHYVHSYIKSAPDLGYDSGIVDTFLHPQDRAYAVPDVLEFARKAGLVFQGWVDNLQYSLRAAIPEGHPLLDRAMSLPPEAQWALVESLALSLGTHRFLLCRPERPEKDYRHDFTSSAALSYIPCFAPGVTVDTEKKSLTRDWMTWSLTPRQCEWILKVDGTKAIRDIVQNGNQARDAMTFFAQAHERGVTYTEIA